MHPKHTILLVEDEKEPADMLANYLEMEDYEVLVAYDGREAISLIENRADVIDLAILDIMVTVRRFVNASAATLYSQASPLFFLQRVIKKKMKLKDLNWVQTTIYPNLPA